MSFRISCKAKPQQINNIQHKAYPDLLIGAPINKSVLKPCQGQLLYHLGHNMQCVTHVV